MKTELKFVDESFEKYDWSHRGTQIVELCNKRALRRGRICNDINSEGREMNA